MRKKVISSFVSILFILNINSQYFDELELMSATGSTIEYNIVTYDIQNATNKLVWNRTPNQGIDYYIIYKEKHIANYYDSIGFVKYNTRNYFLDPDYQFYYRYFITSVDSSGAESVSKDYTSSGINFNESVTQIYPIRLECGHGIEAINLNWNNYGGLESESFSIYTVYRGGDTLNMQRIDDVSLQTNSFVDSDPVARQYRYYYCISAILDEPIYVYESSSIVDTITETSSNIVNNKIQNPVGNLAPTDIHLEGDSAISITEDLPIGSFVGKFSTEDPNPNDNHTYSLVEGQGDQDNGCFYIDGNQLLSNEIFDFEIRNEYSIRIRSMDDGEGNLYFDKQFTIEITDAIETNLDSIISLPNEVYLHCKEEYKLSPQFTCKDSSKLSFLWTPSYGLSNDTIQSPSVVDFTDDITYSLAITDEYRSFISSIELKLLHTSDFLELPNEAMVYCMETYQISPQHIFYDTSLLSYSWSPSTGLDNNTIPNPIVENLTENNTFYYEITDGCDTVIDSIKISLKPYETPSICIVTYDTTSNKYKIIVDEPSGNLAEYRFYKETSTLNEFQQIGAINYGVTNELVDSASNPYTKSERYRISVLDECSIETSQSPIHKTMHLTINQGQNDTWNLIWEKYEGITVSTYKVYRGESESNMQLLESVSGAHSTYTDLSPPSGTLFYQLEIVKEGGCILNTKKSRNADNISSFSNIVDNSHWITGQPNILEMSNSIKVYPNPISTRAVIEIPNILNDIYHAKIYNLLGHEIWSMPNVTVSKIEFIRSDIPAGIYYIEVCGENIYRGSIILK